MPYFLPYPLVPSENFKKNSHKSYFKYFHRAARPQSVDRKTSLYYTKVHCATLFTMSESVNCPSATKKQFSNIPLITDLRYFAPL